jgi:tetratricopeptide (TPR) repeat protein
MSRKWTAPVLLGAFALLLVFSSFGCAKLNVKKLQANYYFSKANQLFRDNKFSKAIVEYESTLRYNPDLKEAYQFLGESYKALYQPGKDTPENNDRRDKALAALGKAYEIDKNNKQIIYSLGDMYDKMRDTANAEKMFLRIIDLEPGNMNNFYIVAEFYKRYAGDNKEFKTKAEDMYLRRIETDPENVQGYAYMADYFEKMVTADGKTLAFNLNSAMEMHKRRLTLEPDSAEVYYTLGVNRCETVRRLPDFFPMAQKEAIAADAEKYLQKAIELDPNWAESYAYMKILYINVHSKLYPERESRYMELATQYGNKWDDARKRQLDRMKLEKELKKTG